MLRNPMVVRQHHLVAGRSISVQKLGFKNYNYQSILMNFNLFKNQKNKKAITSQHLKSPGWRAMSCRPVSTVVQCTALVKAGSGWPRKQRTNTTSFNKNQHFCTTTTTRNCCVGMTVCECVPRRHRDSVHSLLESVEFQYNPPSWSRCTAAKRRRRRRKMKRRRRQDLTHQVSWSIHVMLCWLGAVHARVCVTWL